MKRYVKFSGDNCKLGNFTRNKPYEVIELGKVSVIVISDNGSNLRVMTGVKCGYLSNKESWVFCDEHGSELEGKKKQDYKGQFDLAGSDVKACFFNITEALNRIATN